MCHKSNKNFSFWDDDIQLMDRIRRRLQDKCYKHHHKGLVSHLEQKLLPMSNALQTTSFSLPLPVIELSDTNPKTFQQMQFEHNSTPNFKHNIKKSKKNHEHII